MFARQMAPRPTSPEMAVARRYVAAIGITAMIALLMGCQSPGTTCHAVRIGVVHPDGSTSPVETTRCFDSHGHPEN